MLGTGPHIVAEDEVWTDSWISLIVAGTLDHDGSVELACTAADAWVTNVRLVVISVDSVKPVVLLGESPEPPSLGDR